MKMMNLLFVGLGGFVGASGRYLISTIPYKGDFPLMTLLTNFAGAVFIGWLVGFSSNVHPLNPRLNLFLKTGVCGGFTTFSTFSLEAVTLFERGRVGLGALYGVSSVLCCLGGVLLGKMMWKA